MPDALYLQLRNMLEQMHNHIQTEDVKSKAHYLRSLLERQQQLRQEANGPSVLVPSVSNLSILNHPLVPPDIPSSTFAMGTSLTSSQLKIAVDQIEAYRRISRNEALDESMLRKLNATPQTVLGVLASLQTTVDVDRFLSGDPKTKLVDVTEVVRQREADISARMAARSFELQSLPVNHPLRTKIQIELLSLRLVGLQRQIRSDVARCAVESGPMTTALRRAAYRKVKRDIIREVNQTEKYEREFRELGERRRREKTDAEMAGILEHSRQFREYHKNMKLKWSKIAKSAASQVVTLEREQQKETERLERERMQLLMKQDEQGYRALIDKEKNKRLAFLLEQTDEYVISMATMVKQHQDEELEIEQKRLEAEQNAEASEYETDSDLEELPVDVTEATKPGQESGSLPGDTPVTIQEKKMRKKKQKVPEATAAPIIQAKPVEVEAPSVSAFGSSHTIVEPVTSQPSILVGGELKEYQMKGLEWLVSLYNNKLNGILADEMGLGKTIQTIALFTYLIEKKRNMGPFLVIVPLSTLSNWVLEFDRWSPTITKVVYRGTGNIRKELAQNFRVTKFNVLLTTYEYVIRDKSVLGKIDWKHLVIDEGHRMKNHHCRLTQTLMQAYKAPRRLLLTGTPLQNNLPELWSLLNFLLPNIFKSVDNFEQWFSAPFAGTTEKVELTEEEQMLIIHRLHVVLRPFLLRRLKKEVLTQLPDKVEYVIKCEMSALQRRLYTHMQRNGVILTDEGDDSGDKKSSGTKSLNNTLMQLRKICNHPFMFEQVEGGMARHLRQNSTIHGVDLWRAAGKFEMLDRIFPKLLARNHRCLLFSQMTELLTIMEDYLNHAGIKYLRLDGTTKSEERGVLLQKFNDPDTEYHVFILSTRAGGLGLNLQTADTVIIFDSDWNPHQDQQAQARAHRIGSKSEVRVLRLVTINSVEEKIMASANYKMELDEKIIQAGMFNAKSTGEARREYLMSLLEADTTGMEEESETPAEEALNEMIARSEEELAFFQQMDRERKVADKQWMNAQRRTRLMQEHELPPWALRASSEIDAIMNKGFVDTEKYGSGKRAKKEVVYDDNLTEAQFLRAVDKGSLDEAIEKKRSRRAKARELGEETESDTDEEGENEARVSDKEDSDDGKPVKRKKTSKGKASKPKRTKKSESLPDESVSTAEDPQSQVIKNLIQKLLDFQDSTGRQISEGFLRAPTAQQDPEYAKVIKAPMDFETIKKNIDLGGYRSVSDLELDMELLVNNARTFYDEGTQQYEDAGILKRLFDHERADLEAVDVADMGMDRTDVGDEPVEEPVLQAQIIQHTETGAIRIRIKSVSNPASQSA